MYQTIIIGAGIAGLAAGQYLIENDQENFLVLESAEKIGGRVRTTEFCGKTYPTGPGWLHGRKGNPVYDIMQNLGIAMAECEYEDEAYFVWDTDKGKDVSGEYRKKSLEFHRNFESMSEMLSGVPLDPNESLLDILRGNSDILANGSDLDTTVIHTNKEIYMGAPISSVSGLIEMQSNSVYDTDEGEVNYRILDPRGVPKMIDFLSEAFQNKIKFNSKVKTIVWDQKSHSAVVLTDDGREFTCKNVILTLQSNQLAKKAIAFEPEIPLEKRTAWRHVPSVNYCRVFAKFPQKFWPDKDWLLPVIKNIDPFNELILWQNCQKQNICSAEENILICHYTSGYNRCSSRFDVDKESLKDLVTAAMKNMFPLTFCEPDDVMFVSHWNEDRFSGSFSITAPGFNEQMSEALRRSVGPLHFAGESVNVELMGTMQAAYVTGREAAKKTLVDF